MKARDYPERARDAGKEMHRQVGDLVLDANGLAKVRVPAKLVQRFCRIFLIWVAEERVTNAVFFSAVSYKFTVLGPNLGVHVVYIV